MASSVLSKRRHPETRGFLIEQIAGSWFEEKIPDTIVIYAGKQTVRATRLVKFEISWKNSRNSHRSAATSCHQRAAPQVH